MERLTFAGAKFAIPPKVSKQDLRDEIKSHQEYYDKLVEYENIEEQGLLIKLPCKVGDTVYWVSHFNSGINYGTVNSIRLSKFGFDIEISSGTALFWREYEKLYLSHEAAEEALKGANHEEI